MTLAPVQFLKAAQCFTLVHFHRREVSPSLQFLWPRQQLWQDKVMTLVTSQFVPPSAFKCRNSNWWPSTQSEKPTFREISSPLLDQYCSHGTHWKPWNSTLANHSFDNNCHKQNFFIDFGVFFWNKGLLKMLSNPGPKWFKHLILKRCSQVPV